MAEEINAIYSLVSQTPYVVITLINLILQTPIITRLLSMKGMTDKLEKELADEQKMIIKHWFDNLDNPIKN